MSEELYTRIAVISDLHCQKETNSSKVTRLHTQLLDNPVNKNPVEAFKEAIKREKKQADYFFVLGDVANKADVDGFLLGVKLVKEIFADLNAKKLIFAVGNHDMLREDDQQDPKIIMKNTNGFPFLFKRNKTVNIENDFWANDFCIIEDKMSIILVINSSSYIKSSTSKALEITEPLVEKIENQLSALKSLGKIKIALTHHHPTPHSDFNDKYTSLDCLEYGDRLTDLLNRNNFTIFLHGHKHFPRMKFDNQLPIFCSGSFSSLENTYSFNEDNTAHFINIYKNGDSFKGIIETWIYNERNGWKQSTDLSVRFPALTGFGLRVDVDRFLDAFYSHFYESIENTNAAYIPIPYENVIEKFPDFSYLSPSQQREFDKKLFDKYLISTNQNKQTLKKTFVKNYNK